MSLNAIVQNHNPKLLFALLFVHVCSCLFMFARPQPNADSFYLTRWRLARDYVA